MPDKMKVFSCWMRLSLNNFIDQSRLALKILEKRFVMLKLSQSFIIFGVTYMTLHCVASMAIHSFRVSSPNLNQSLQDNMLSQKFPG